MELGKSWVLMSLDGGLDSSIAFRVGLSPVTEYANMLKTNFREFGE